MVKPLLKVVRVPCSADLRISSLRPQSLIVAERDTRPEAALQTRPAGWHDADLMTAAPSTEPDVGGDSELRKAMANAARDPSLDRIAGFSDAVFAFAITLLILAIRIPHPTDEDAGRGLLALLTQEWRSYLAFALSFMLVGINWTNHRVMWSKFQRSDHQLVWLNLLYLMIGVVFIPIPTAVLGAWLGSSDNTNQVVAAVFYGVAATAGGITYNVVWWYGAHVAKLTYPQLSARVRRSHTLTWGAAPVGAAILTAVAFFNPSLAVAGLVSLVFAYVLPLPRLLVYRRRERAQSGSRRP